MYKFLQRGEQRSRRENGRICYSKKEKEHAISMVDQKIKLLGIMAEFLGLLAMLMHHSWYLRAHLQVLIVPSICSMERGKKLKSETSATIIEYLVY